MRAPLRRTTAVPAAVLVVLATALAFGPDAAAAAGPTRSATAHMTVFVRATARATVSATESATVAVAGYTATSRATVARTAASTAGAWGTAGARAVARAPRAALALARARSLASSVARHRATARAQATAARRAYADARLSAHASAVAAARAVATARARAEAGAAYTASKIRPAPSAPCGGLTPAKPGGGTYVCSFDEEFNGSALDQTKWNVLPTSSTGVGDGGVCYLDSPSNVSVSGGYLNLTARKTAAPFTCKTPSGGYTTQYTGGDIATNGKFSQAYGRFDVRASFPASTVAGLQSSLWLWPDNSLKYGAWPSSGELDIAEEYSQYADRAIPFLHYTYDPSTTDLATNTNVPTNQYCLTDVHSFHDYVLDWTPTTLTVTIDGTTCLVDNYQAYGQTGSAPFDSPFFVALTQAIGQGENAVTSATQFPAVTRVDYVRVWK